MDEALRAGAKVAILRAVWPRMACTEMAGRAWQATVVARAAGRATVRFHAHARDGRPYEDVCLSLEVLRHVE